MKAATTMINHYVTASLAPGCHLFAKTMNKHSLHEARYAKTVQWVNSPSIFGDGESQPYQDYIRHGPWSRW